MYITLCNDNKAEMFRNKCINQHILIFCDEATFHISGKVNVHPHQNTQPKKKKR
jgi:hypothetical protein